MDGDIRSRVVSLEHTAQSNTQRLTTLEAWQRQRDIDSARHDEKWSAMENRIDVRFASLEKSTDARFSGLEESNKGIQGSLTWINRLIIGTIAVGILGFLMKGGFHLP